MGMINGRLFNNPNWNKNETPLLNKCSGTDEVRDHVLSARHPNELLRHPMGRVVARPALVRRVLLCLGGRVCRLGSAHLRQATGREHSDMVQVDTPAFLSLYLDHLAHRSKHQP